MGMIHIKINITLILLVSLSMAMPCSGQAIGKKYLSQGDYGLWCTAVPKGISGDGKWISVHLGYESSLDTLALINSGGDRKYDIAGASGGIFAGPWFFASDDKERLVGVNLTDGSKEITEKVKRYKFAAQSNLLITVLTGSDGDSLVVREPGKKPVLRVGRIAGYAINSKGTGIIVCTANVDSQELRIYDLLLMDYTVIDASESDTFTNFVWQDNGLGFTFMKVSRPATAMAHPVLKYYSSEQKKLYSLDLQNHSREFAGKRLSMQEHGNVSIVNHGKTILVKVMEPVKDAADKSTVQIWNGADTYIYPVSRFDDGSVKPDKVVAWDIMDDKLTTITDNIFSDIMMPAGQAHLIKSNPGAYEPQYNYDAPRDYIAVNLETLQETVIVRNQPGEWGKVSLSPGGKYFTYFKDAHWWCYDISKGTSANLTKLTDGQFAIDDGDYPFDLLAHGNPGWTSDDKEVWLYDKYDIWSIEIEKLRVRRITDGHQKSIRYRIIPSDESQRPVKNYDGFTSGRLDVRSGVFIEAAGEDFFGLYLYTGTGNLRKIYEGALKISTPFKATDGKSVIYLEQDYDVPPRIRLAGKGKDVIVYQSNQQHNRYHWGKSKVVKYRNARGEELTGALFYPAGYSEKKKYPMIVHVYDKQASKVHDYVNPSLYSGNGFNVSNYTLNGFFVLLPDITYELGNPGMSAADCVTAAVKKVIATEDIDASKIGLIGHSFGGYEVDFIITQTDIFAAAVAGAAITDLSSSYLYVSWNYGKPNFWHYESGQLRMHKPLFSNFLGYIENSPIYHAGKIKTPLLSWAGEEDRQVHHTQSLEFYLALRRLGKKHVMFIYPGQRHVLTDTVSQAHLTKSIYDWFGHYLKGEPLPEWALPDRPH